MVEASNKIGRLHFTHDILNLISQNEAVEEDRRHENLENRLSNELDIQMVDN